MRRSITAAAAALALLDLTGFVAARPAERVAAAAPMSLFTGAPAARAHEGGQASRDSDETLHRPLDEILDLYVRDGYVYYTALKSDRAKLDRYLASLDSGATGSESWPVDRQIALWLNAYNGFVLQTVVNHYPIRGRSSSYPADSIRQVPGAFDRSTHRVGGRAVTLDAIEKTILPAFKDPRVYLALGRGAAGSGRLRSEAYTASRLGAQLKEDAAEAVSRPALVRVDQVARRITVSPIFGWREDEFVAAYASGADPRFASRSPMERAIVAFITPNLLPDEVEFVNQNNFQVAYGTFDWSLNDLKTRR